VSLVYCHPLEGSFISAARDRAVSALRESGHDVRVTDLYAEGFRPELDRDEHVRYMDDPATKPDLAAHVELLRWCEALVLVYPTWWSGQPAMLKGWIDRVWVPGVAFDVPADATHIRPLLTNIRRIVAITSHGSSKWVNAVEGENGKRTITRAIRLMCSRRVRTGWLALYGIDRTSPERREQFLQRIERRMRRL
jgi:putative NADPH-quinone reductase